MSELCRCRCRVATRNAATDRRCIFGAHRCNKWNICVDLEAARLGAAGTVLVQAAEGEVLVLQPTCEPLVAPFGWERLVQWDRLLPNPHRRVNYNNHRDRIRIGTHVFFFVILYVTLRSKIFSIFFCPPESCVSLSQTKKKEKKIGTLLIISLFFSSLVFPLGKRKKIISLKHFREKIFCTLSQIIILLASCTLVTQFPPTTS